MAEYKIDVMGCDVVTVEADTSSEAECLINSGKVKIPYKDMYMNGILVGLLIRKNHEELN